nr:unnamed protein product [Callosobruchus chinensis]
MYNSTPHTITGKTPSELFFRRQFRDKIPSAADTENLVTDEETRDRDRIQKEKGKEHEDRKRRATQEVGIEIGDKVYPKNFSKVTKIMPDYEDSEHTVISKQGGDVLIKNDNSGQLYRRNIVHLKKVEGKWKICNE